MISIITSLYKSEKYLNKYFKHVNSFIKKANFNFEIILILNEPTEKELEIIDKNKINNMRVITVPRENLYSTWNRGISLSKYKNITFWNVDDIRFPEAIEEGLEKIEKGSEIIYFPFIYKRYINIFKLDILAKRKKITPLEYSREKFIKEMHSGPFFMINKNVFNKIGRFDTDFKIAGDFELCAKAAHNNIKFKKVNIISGIFTNNGKTLSGSKNSLQNEENKIVYDRYR